MIIPNILNYFFSKVLLGIEDEANKNGYQIIICLSNNKYQKEVQSLELLSDGSVDGFILSIARETQVEKRHNHFKKIIEDGYPIVMFDRVSEHIECDKVIIDDFEATFNATNYLLSKGRKKIILISTVSKLDIGKQRTEGYKHALQQNLHYQNKPIVIPITDKTQYDAIIEKLFNDHKNIDGVLTTNNVSAVTALHLAEKNDLHIPRDISIIGFSDDKLSRLSYPKLTTIDQYAFEMGKKAANTLISRITEKSKTAYCTKVLKTDLIVRETS